MDELISTGELKYEFLFSFDDYLLIMNALDLAFRYGDPRFSDRFRELFDRIFIVPYGNVQRD